MKKMWGVAAFGDLIIEGTTHENNKRNNKKDVGTTINRSFLEEITRDVTFPIANKGITLISLVVTIIILIILAGVGINLSLGENGLFSRN